MRKVHFQLSDVQCVECLTGCPAYMEVGIIYISLIDKSVMEKIVFIWFWKLGEKINFVGYALSAWAHTTQIIK